MATYRNNMYSVFWSLHVCCNILHNTCNILVGRKEKSFIISKSVCEVTLRVCLNRPQQTHLWKMDLKAFMCFTSGERKCSNYASSFAQRTLNNEERRINFCQRYENSRLLVYNNTIMSNVCVKQCLNWGPVLCCISGQIHGAAAPAGAASGKRAPTQSRWQDSWAGPGESGKGG